jgi:NitT/TauT family transport system substrate-binding protein
MALLLFAGAAAACGDDDDGGDDAAATTTESGGGGDELTPIKVGILPIADLAPLYHGISEGIFEEEGLDVSTEIGQGGAALVPSVMEGDYQFAFGNYVSLMLARQNNVEVQIVSNLVNGADTEDRGTNALLVKADSGIESLDDLAGKKFAVSTLNNIAEVTIRTTLREAGVDDGSIEFVELAFPTMNDAVAKGDVDVAWQAEPFVTLGKASGLVSLADPMFGTMPSMPLAGFFASESWLADNADVAEAFTRALARSIEAAEDDEVMRTAIADNTETPPDVVEELALANWDAELDTDALGEVASLAVDYEVLAEEPDLDQLVWSPE